MKLWSKLLVLSGLIMTLTLGVFSVYATPISELLPTGYVVDQANAIDSQSLQNLTQKLETINKTRSAQGAVVTVQNLDGRDIESYSTDVFRKFGIGDAKTNNGFLVLISVEDRKSRIEVGYGAEAVLTDARSRRILDGANDSFKAGQYGAGLSKIVNEIDDLLSGDPETATRLDTPTKSKTSWQDILPAIVIGLFFVLPWLAAILGRSKSWWGGGVVGGGLGVGAGLLVGWWWAIAGGIIGGLILDYFVSKNFRDSGSGGPSWWAGGPWMGGGGSDGGSFGGFDGGSSGGGGSSSNW